MQLEEVQFELNIQLENKFPHYAKSDANSLEWIASAPWLFDWEWKEINFVQM